MSGPYLILTAPTGDKTKYPIQQNSIAIGRSEENNDIIVRNDGGVSRWHCRIDYGAGQAHLSDCGSANGTIVNNVEVDSGGFGFKLSDGDIISIGDTVLEYKAPPAPAVPARRSGVDGKRKKAPAKPSRQSSASKPAGGVVSNIKKIEQKREARRAKAQREAEKKKDRQMKMAIKGVTAEGEILDFADMIDVYHEKNEVPKDEVCMGLPMWPNLKIRVCIRKRPLTSKEKNKGGLEGLDVVTCNCTDRSQIAVVHEPKQKVDLSKYMENHPFKFDQVLDETCDNDVSYQCTAAPLVPYVFKGKKATCFAYGQTGSGKTWTMSGEDRIIGVYQMVARDIFKSLSVHVSYFEIYQGHVFDLLNKRNRLMVLEDGKGKVGLKGLTEYAVKDTQSLLSAIDKGNSVRRQGSTSANARSSRSHGIFQIFLRTPGRRVKKLYGKFSLIDLAGSERGKDTAHADRRRRIEGAEINKSLLALKECIRAMSDRKGHLPFRASKLTQVLKDSFIGGSRTVMIACVSPSGGNTEHTMNTLRYADRVKEIAGQREPGSARGKVGVVRTPEPIVKQQPPEEEEAGTPGNVNWNDYDESDAIKKLQQSLPEEQMDKFMAHSILVSELMRNETRVVDLHKKLLEQQQIWSGDEKKHLTLAMSSEDEYDSDTYASFLEKMVAHKLQALQSLQKEVAKFKKNLAAEQQSSS
eukprot:jgi/Bigna1/133501/aug1.21_g8209